MAKYKVIRDSVATNLVPEGSGMPNYQIPFKTGENYEGVEVTVGGSNYVDLKTSKGTVRVLMSTTTGRMAAPTFIEEVPETIPTNGVGRLAAPSEDKKEETLFTPLNIGIAMILVVGALVALKWKKII